MPHPFVFTPEIHLARGSDVQMRIDTAIEVDYYRAGGIFPYVLRQLL